MKAIRRLFGGKRFYVGICASSPAERWLCGHVEAFQCLVPLVRTTACRARELEKLLISECRWDEELKPFNTNVAKCGEGISRHNAAPITVYVCLGGGSGILHPRRCLRHYV